MFYIDDINQIVQILEREGVIAYPTDTIWGLGCAISSEKAYQRIASIKGRDKKKPFILLVDSVDMLKEHIDYLHPRVETLLNLHDRPLTLIYDFPKNLPDYALADNGTIGIRVVKDSFCRDLINRLGQPIVSTSANFSNNPPPDIFTDIDPKMLRKVDYVVLYRRDDTSKSAPSVIARYDKKGELQFIRE